MTCDSPEVDGRLRLIAARLGEVATGVAADAGAATEAVRGVAEQARAIAALAEELEVAAIKVAGDVAHHLSLLARAHDAAVSNEQALNAFAGATDNIRAMAERIGGIATTSRLLAINTRIEAALAGATGNGFAVVASEMTQLATQTKAATEDITGHAVAIGGDLNAARRAIEVGSNLVAKQEQAMAAIAATADAQRRGASSVAALTGETVASVDRSATAIGRVASAAGIVNLLARQMLHLTADDLAA